jgi:hypothetical protein
MNAAYRQLMAQPLGCGQVRGEVIVGAGLGFQRQSKLW